LEGRAAYEILRATILVDELDSTTLKMPRITCVASYTPAAIVGGNITMNAFGTRDRDDQRFMDCLSRTPTLRLI
jgi:hypothetical protein